MASWTLEWDHGPLTVTLPDDNLRVLERNELPVLGPAVGPRSAR